MTLLQLKYIVTVAAAGTISERRGGFDQQRNQGTGK